MSTLKPHGAISLGSSSEEEVTACLMSIRPILRILTQQLGDQNGKENWIKKKLVKIGNTTYNVSIVLKYYYGTDELQLMVSNCLEFQ